MLQEFKELITEFGESITINEETRQRKAVVTSTNVNENNDDRIFCTDFKINAGDYITYQGTRFLVISPVAAKRSFEYKVLARPTDVHKLTFKIKDAVEEIIGYEDATGMPIYEEVEPAQYDSFSVIVETLVTDYTTGQPIVLPDDEYYVFIPYHEKLTQGYEVELYGRTFTIKGIDKTKLYELDEGLLRLRIEL